MLVSHSSLQICILSLMLSPFCGNPYDQAVLVMRDRMRDLSEGERCISHPSRKCIFCMWIITPGIFKTTVRFRKMTRRIFKTSFPFSKTSCCFYVYDACFPLCQKSRRCNRVAWNLVARFSKSCSKFPGIL